MAYLIGVISAVATFFAGWVLRGSVVKSQGEQPPLPRDELILIYDMIRKDVIDNVARDKTIEKLEERLK
jgi:hypothetical protein